MADELSETPNEITFDVWLDYAKRRKTDELFKTMEERDFPLLPIEANPGPVSADSIRKYVLDQREKFGTDKLTDMYTFRRMSQLLKNANNDEGSLNVAFVVMFESYNQVYYDETGNSPELIVSIFGPAMEAISEDETRKIIGTFISKERTERILTFFREKQ